MGRALRFFGLLVLLSWGGACGSSPGEVTRTPVVLDGSVPEDGAVAVPCGSARTCGECVTHGAACGFCASSGTCVEGDASGPLAGECAEWRFDGNSCGQVSQECTTNPDCGSCLNDGKNCGWCAEKGVCYPGTDQGPASPFVCLGNLWWRGDSLQCPDSSVARCEDLTFRGCGVCAQRFDCVWCPGPLPQCVEGDGLTPPGRANCTAWIPDASQCVAK